MKTDSFLDRSSVKKILQELDLVPTKRLGQSFMVDRGALARIVEVLDLTQDDVVVEVGPGLGALTRIFATKAKRLIAIEFDPKIAQYLKVYFKDSPAVSVVEADILKVDLILLLEGWGPKFKVVGNLPYKISTQILFKFLECPLHFEKMVFAFQWEVAQRLMSNPGSKAYGALSLTAQFYAQIKKVLRIKKQSFYPEPEVDTGILAFIPRRLDLGLSLGAEKRLLDLIKQAFSKRRKTLRNALTRQGGFHYPIEIVGRALERCSFGAQVRAEDLRLEDFAYLLKRLEEM